ncbi:hypothetical protein TNIN_438171 [Trichonephila inaurata madagascariensis]|uniref:Uncharacterized protein n=1 Tax=Trichonephila inaurata madagascariensis TaxID=2747483 RepID=A0A8X6XLP8_9ARAC|nr:hypothetical protein TNIN_438171 [Trichonephila inaurata madagascariensis]
MTVVSMLNRISCEHATTLQNVLSKLKEESVKTRTTFEPKLSELRKKNEEQLKKEEIKICHEKQFQSQKEELDSELKNEDQKLAEILENNEKFFEVISEEKDEMLLDLQNQLKTKEIEISSSSQAKKLGQELDEMKENDEELKILHEKNVLSSKESQGKSFEMNKLLAITEKELQQKECKTNSLRNMIKEKEYHKLMNLAK